MDIKQLDEQIARVMELDAKRTQGEWSVRSRDIGGELTDCFVQAPDCNGFPYNAEILGDDEYHEQSGGLARRLSDCTFIAAAPTMASIIRQLVDIVTQQHEALGGVKQYMLEQTMGQRAGTHPKEMQLSVYQALALSAPIVNMKRGG